jgi:hypothetical protein
MYVLPGVLLDSNGWPGGAAPDSDDIVRTKDFPEVG